MPSIYDLKPAFQDLLRPVVRSSQKRESRRTKSPIRARAFDDGRKLYRAFPSARWPLILLGPALIIRMALNAMDGLLARELDMGSAKGVMLNEMGDVVSDCAMYLRLRWFPGLSQGSS
jgi:CDP-diacylglycerol--glycerol-3-phosphate 3-phosphatidyltransferase